MGIYRGNGIDDIHTVWVNFSEDGKSAILIIEVCRVVSVIDKKLCCRRIRIVTNFCHSDRPANIAEVVFV